MSLAGDMTPDDAMVHHCTLGSLEGIWTCLVVVSLESRFCSLVAFCKRKILKPLPDLFQPQAATDVSSLILAIKASVCGVPLGAERDLLGDGGL